jgi:rod shape determining protein RodA
MFQIDRKLMKNIDWGLTFLIFLILTAGLINLYSATSEKNVTSNLYFLHQIYWNIMGIIGMATALCISDKFYKENAVIFYIISLILLLLVDIYGMITAGAQRWIRLGPVSLQPSELAKLSLILVLGYYYDAKKNQEILPLLALIVPIILAVIPVGLIIKQPDLGTAILLLLIFLSVMLYEGISIKLFCGMFAAGLAALPLLWGFLKPYQKARLLTFINPDRDPLGAGYHIIQSKIAVGSGGVWGKGFLRGTQCKLQFLPEHHTDFVFSVLAEEWGFVGSLTVIFLLGLLIVWGLEIARQAKDRFGEVVAVGITAMFFWQVVINIGMVIGVMPVVGIPLPFFSYGGSASLTNLFAIGILMSIRMRQHAYPASNY